MIGSNIASAGAEFNFPIDDQRRIGQPTDGRASQAAE
jgi:hypothetical protein